MNTKKISLLFLAIILSVSSLLIPSTKAEASTMYYSLYVNGYLIEKSGSPSLNGKVYTSVKNLETILTQAKMGLSSGKITLVTKGVTYKFTNNSTKVEVKGSKTYTHTMSKPAVAIKGKMYIPVDYASNQFGMSLKGDVKNKRIDLTTSTTGEKNIKAKYSKVHGEKFSSSNLTQSRMLVFSHLAYNNLVQGKTVSELTKSLGATMSGLTNEQVFESLNMHEWKVYKTSDKVIIPAYGNLWRSGMYGVIFQNSYTREYVVAFRGSEGGDWWRDYVVADAGKVVAGLKNPLIAKQVTDAMLFTNTITPVKNLTTKKEDPSTISFTGHSLGGYLAQSVSVQVYQKKKLASYSNPAHYKYKEIVTFNAPGLFKAQSLPKTKHHHIDGDVVGVVGYHAGGNMINYKMTKRLGIKDSHRLINFYNLRLK